MMKIYIKALLICFLCTTSVLFAQRQMEKLNRGLVAVRTSTSQVFLSWRLLGTDPDNIAFNLYRDGVRITSTPISAVTNYTDASSTGTVYSVKPVINGVETGENNQASAWTNNYMEIPMQVPDSMTMPDGTKCGYSPNDCSVGDVDGDGEYEIIVKWDPSNSHDNSQGGYTGDVYLDCYKLNGTRLWKYPIDLGKNIRAGAHYVDVEVEDFDGDGKAEIAVKTAPGTKDGTGTFLSKGPAASDNDAADYRNTSGYILLGPEYLSVFSGLTGAELATTYFIPARNTSITSNDVSGWGDNYGNRVDRFLACTAYLDGLHPSVVMCRGYYTRVCLTAWDYKNGTLTQRWKYDSNSPNGVNAAGQGNHNLSVADIDDDGKDEIVYGASAFDDDGKCLYSTGLGHGDAMHLTDLDPDRKGLEVWEVHESTGAAYGYEMHDAKTGQILWGGFTGSDNGRGLAANVNASSRGFEMWSAAGPGVSSCKGTTLATSSPSMNFRIYWDGDFQDELLDNISITKYGVGTLLSASGCSSNNSTKATPNLSADIFGDWREELILRTSDNTKLRIYTTTIATTNKLYTLMHDAQYRDAIAWQNAGYNQPPHAGFYIGDDMDTPPPSAAYNGEKRWKSGTIWDNNTTASWTDSLSQVSTFKNGDGVLFDVSAGANAAVTVSGSLTPSNVKVNSPYNVTLSGDGELSGDMTMKKVASGILTLNNNNSYTGATTVWTGDFYNNGNLSNSEVNIKSFVKLGGKGIFGNNVTLANNTTLSPGATTGEAAKMTFSKALKESGAVTYNLDIVMNTAGNVVANDTIIVNGDWTNSGKSTFAINPVNGTIKAGDYKIMHCSGAVPSDLAKITVTGIPTSLSFKLLNQDGDIILKVKAPSTLAWSGSVNTTWDVAKTSNWIENASAQTFMSNDSVLFNDNATTKTVVMAEPVTPGAIKVDASANYSFSGTGYIDGVGGMTKNGTGKLSIYTSNKYTGQTIINGGILEFSSLTNGGVASSVGAASNLPANIQMNGGRINYTGATVSTDRGFTVGQNGGTFSVVLPSSILTTTGKLTGAGKLIKEGAGTLGLSVVSDYKGGTQINAGTLTLATDVANTSGLGSGGDTITFKGGTLSMYDSNTTSNTSNWNIVVPTGATGTLKTDGKSTIVGSLTGAGTLNYYTNYIGNYLQSDASKFAGTINVTTDADGGYFIPYNTKGLPLAKVYLNNLVTMMYPVSANVKIPVGDLTGGATSVLGAGGTSACTITWSVGSLNANSTFSGVINNTQYSGTGAVAAIVKEGTGTWTLTNSNAYTGGTTVNGGTLMVNNTTGSGLGTGAVIVNAGGTLAGTGIISGAVTVNSEGVLSTGNNGTGTLTVNNSVNLAAGSIWAVDIDKTNVKNDLLTLTSTLNVAGKLQVTALNGTSFAAGDEFKIVNGTVLGIPTEVIPAQPASGLAWDLSELATRGVLKVTNAAGVNTPQVVTRIYPNPFRNTITVDLGSEATDLQVSLESMLGQTVYMQQASNTAKLQMNLSGLSDGVYLLKVKADNQEFVKKIVKE
jgi:Uncharacterized protein with a C-terminal OMP (outer membrane protein) domain